MLYLSLRISRLSEFESLTADERKALAPKLVANGETAKDAFDHLVTVIGDATATAANIRSVQNFIAQAGGLKNTETWQHITSIVKVNASPVRDIKEPVAEPERRPSSTIEIRVNKKDKFLAALQRDPINKFRVNALTDAGLKAIGASGHPYDNARAQTTYRSDPQLHYANDKSEDKNFGPNYFFVHWDACSSKGSKSTIVGDARGGLAHGPSATIANVNEYLKRTHQARR